MSDRPSQNAIALILSISPPLCPLRLCGSLRQAVRVASRREASTSF
ncbi:MAG: hypothetical protein V7K90_04950 [Nostoc sp.]